MTLGLLHGGRWVGWEGGLAPGELQILNLGGKVSESNMVEAESKMAEFKMAAIIKLSENEWVWVRLN